MTLLSGRPGPSQPLRSDPRPTLAINCPPASAAPDSSPAALPRGSYCGSDLCELIRHDLCELIGHDLCELIGHAQTSA